MHPGAYGMDEGPVERDALRLAAGHQRGNVDTGGCGEMRPVIGPEQVELSGP
jgi:hypothetical protein